MTTRPLHEILDILDELAPLAYAEDFDNVGLLVGNQNQNITGILVTHDALENVVTEAVDKKCNLIVCFHPIIFSGLKKLTGKTYVERAVIKAIKNDIAIYAVHTALDNMPDGVSHTMCEALGLSNTKVLIPKKNQLQKLVTYVPAAHKENLLSHVYAAGAGHIGKYKDCSFSLSGNGTYTPLTGAQPHSGSVGQASLEPEEQIHLILGKHKQSAVLKALFTHHPYEEVSYEITNLENENQHLGLGMIGELDKEQDEQAFLNHIKSVFKTGGVRHSALLGKKIKKVAVLGGSGAFAIAAAKAQGADVYITADLKYHDYYQAENKILLADVGHFESERFTKSHIARYLTKKLTNFAVILSSKNTNPINYS